MSKKTRKKSKKVVALQAAVVYPTFCGFKLIKENYNRLWRWDTLHDVVNS